MEKVTENLKNDIKYLKLTVLEYRNFHQKENLVQNQMHKRFKIHTIDHT